MTLETIEQHIPKRIIRSNGEVHQKWTNRDTTLVRKMKVDSWKKYRKRKTPENYAIYARHRNDSVHVNREAKYNFEMSLANDIENGDVRAFYAYMRSQTTIKEKVTRVTKTDGSLSSSWKETADTFNSTFQSVFVIEGDGTVHQPNFSFGGPVLENFEFSRKEVFDILVKLRSNSAPGPDGLHPKYLIECADLLAEPLYWLFRDSLDSSTIPDNWKIDVTPIFKSGKKSNALNYRPVSLTSIVCKVMERIVRDRIVDHLIKHKLLSKLQHGFRANRSCLTQLLEYFQEVHDMLDAGKPVDAIYLDCKKAFDTIPHKRLLAKLEAYGITGKLLKWIECFLTNRTQRVVVNGVLSDILPVLSGVPQGSVLGPLLFLIYINDLLDGISSNGKLFADDSKIFREIVSEEDSQILQEDLYKLQEWSRKWLIEFNEAKCKVMHISKRNTNPKYDYTINGTTIKETTLEKDLGIYVTLNWKSSAHVAKVAAKANSMVGRIRHTFTYMNRTIFLKVYPSIVRCHMEYAVQAWSPQLIKDIGSLEKVQKRATKLVPELCDKSYEERLELLGLTTLEERRRRGDLIEVFKIMNGLEDIDRGRFFELKKEISSHATRGHDYSIHFKQSNSALRKGFFDIRVRNDWNSLPTEVVNCQSLSSFKKALDGHYKQRHQ